jgi:GNAT superfamily N-acetyltransferase
MVSDETGAGNKITVKYYRLTDQDAVDELSVHHLAEQGIFIDSEEDTDSEEETRDSDTDEYDSDLDHIDEVYLSGDGGFWIAWSKETPVGNIGAQDIGGFVELRRMYVREKFRRRGIGTLLVRSLIEHCKSRGIRAIELFTHRDGPGRYMYKKLGFRKIKEPGGEFQERWPKGEWWRSTRGTMDDSSQIRMRLDIQDHGYPR